MTFNKSNFTEEFCEKLLEEQGSVKLAALSIFSECVGVNGGQVAARTVEDWIREKVVPRKEAREAARAQATGNGMGLSRPNDPERPNRLDDLIDRANVPLDEVGEVEYVDIAAYGGFMKDKDGNAVKVPLFSTKTRIRPRKTAQEAAKAKNMELVIPAASTVINYYDAPRILRKTSTHVVISDIQAGFLRHTQTGALEPIHDDAALDVAYQITADMQPKGLHFIGDVADLAGFSRWAQPAEFNNTLQPSIQVVHEILGTFVAAAGKNCTKKMMIGSNHDQRIEKSVQDWNKEAVGLRRANDAPSSWPVFSLGYLARFDDLGLEWSGQYPGGEWFLLDDLVLMHAPPKSKEFMASVIHGHTHKVTRDLAVIHGCENGEKIRKTFYVYDIGCLCQLGITEDKFRLGVTKTPSDRGRTNWAHGIAVVNVVEATGSHKASHSVDQIAINDGNAIYGGQIYQARKKLVTP